MKQRTMIALMAALIVQLIFCSGCSDETQKIQPSVFGYTSKIIDVPMELGEPVAVAIHGNILSVSGYLGDLPTLGCWNLQTDEWAMKAMGSNADNMNTVYGLNAASNGDIYYMLGENPLSEDVIFSGQYVLELYTATQSDLIEEIYVQLPADILPDGLFVSSDGKIVIWSYNNIWILDHKGKLLQEIACDSISGISQLDDILFVRCTYNGEKGYRTLNLNTGSLSGFTPDSIQVLTTTCTSQQNLFLINSISGPKTWNADTKTYTDLFQWSAVEVFDGSYVSSIVLMEDGSVFCIDLRTGQLLQISYGPIEERTVLTLAISGENTYLNEAVSNFNRNSDEYRIEIHNYNEPFNPNKLVELTADMISDNCPDIVIPASFEIDASAAGFEDLCAYLEVDQTLSQEDFVPNILQGMMTDGGLYEIYPGFMIETLFLDTNHLKNETWSLDTAQKLDVFHGYTQSYLLNCLCMIAEAEFIDWDNRSCNFTDERFIQWLELCGSLSDATAIGDEKPFVQFRTVSSYKNAVEFSDLNEVTCVGYPDSIGNGSYLNYNFMRFSLAIPTGSSHKQAAWSFIRTYLLPSTQAGSRQIGFPIREDALYQCIDLAIQDDSNAFSKEDAEQLIGLIVSTEKAAGCSKGIQEMIEDEAAAYFKGECTAQEAAKRIQSRAEIYISETCG